MHKITKKPNEKLIEAEKRLKDYNKIIAPFIKKREIVYKTTQGKWQTSDMQITKNCRNIYC